MSRNEWTIMIYLAGDNDLSVDMAYAMEQLKGIAGEEANGTHLFVYYDGNSESIPSLYCDFSDSANPKHVRSFKVPNKLYRVEPKRNENAADYRSVLNFVDWCVNKVEVETDGSVRRGRRADKYGLIFSGHTLGFNDPGLFKDESSGKTMKMADMFLLVDRLTTSKDELADKIHDLDLEYEKDHRFDYDPDADRRRSTVLLGQPLDILGFDSCVMGMLEVGYQYKGAAKTMIASEGSVPSAGWTYAKILGSLAREMTPLDDNEVAARFVTQFIKSQDSFTVGGVSVDMAAWGKSRGKGRARPGVPASESHGG
ncbi:MAG: clostripain-related cysteine peptidase [Pyrinomonadaceae bacterium]